MNIDQMNYLPVVSSSLLPVVATGVVALFVRLLAVVSTGVAAVFVCLLPMMATGVVPQTPTAATQITNVVQAALH